MTPTIAIFKRHLQVFRRTWWTNTIFNFIEPFLYLAAMGFGLGAFVPEMEGVSYLQFIAPGMVASSAMWAATFECTYASFIRLHFQKTFHAMLASPLTISNVVAGEVLFGVFKNVVFGIVILGVITGIGQVQSYWALLIPPFLILPGMVFSIMALAYTGLVTHIDYMNYYITLLITPAYLFSGIFFPVSSMPDILQVVTWVNPLYHSVEVCRALVLGRVSLSLAWHAGALLLLSAVLVALPVRLLKKRLIS